MSCYSNYAVCALSESDYDAISLKLIKQKTRGIISDYHFNGECWDVKARNGAVYSGQLDLDGNCFGGAVWYCEGQTIKKYYNCPMNLDIESFDIYDEAIELCKKEQTEKSNLEVDFDNNTFLEDENFEGCPSTLVA